MAEPTCTGISAVWCPVHGDCSCRWRDAAAPQIRGMNDPACPLHGEDSDHAEGRGRRPRIPRSNRRRFVAATIRSELERWEGLNTIDAGDDPVGHDGGYDRHGNRITQDAMLEIVAWRTIAHYLLGERRDGTPLPEFVGRALL